jgi:hypothetical protein
MLPPEKKAMLVDNIEGRFIQANGVYSCYYLHRNTCYSMTASKEVFGLIISEEVQNSHDYPVILSGYKAEQSEVMQVIGCTNAVTWTNETNRCYITS